MTIGYTNYEWFLKQDFKEYSGKWIAIIDQKVVEYGDNVKQIIENTRLKYPAKKPFITKIRDKLSIL